MIKKIKSLKITDSNQNIYFADKGKISDLQKNVNDFKDSYPHFSCALFEEYIAPVNLKYETYGDYENNILSKIYIAISTFLISDDSLKNSKNILDENNLNKFLSLTSKKEYEHSNNIIPITSNKIFIGNPLIEEGTTNQNNEFAICDLPNGDYKMYLLTDKSFDENYKKLNNLYRERGNHTGKQIWNKNLGEDGEYDEEITLGWKVYSKKIDKFIFQSPNIAFISIELHR